MTEELNRSVGRIEGKLDALLDQTKNFDKRISSVEKKVWYGSGIGAVLAFISTKLLGHS